jgi:hypothetical protein
MTAQAHPALRCCFCGKIVADHGYVHNWSGWFVVAVPQIEIEP